MFEKPSDLPVDRKVGLLWDERSRAERAGEEEVGVVAVADDLRLVYYITDIYYIRICILVLITVGLSADRTPEFPIWYLT